jgi:hypothetical protein
VTTERTDRGNEIIAARSQADFVITRPLLLHQRKGSVAGLRGSLLRTPEHIRIRVRGDTRTFTLDHRPVRPVDSDRWPEIELEVEATRFTWDQRLIAGRARLSLGERSIAVDAMIHDVGGAPAGGGLPERQFVAVRVTVPRGLLIEGIPESIGKPRWDQLRKLDLHLYIESAVPWTGE